MTFKGFQTYTFWLGDVQRCFTVFHPPTRSSEVLPVVLAPNCYAKDKLQGIEALNAKSDGNAAAVRFGFARIGLSTPDGAWTFGKLKSQGFKKREPKGCQLPARCQEHLNFCAFLKLLRKSQQKFKNY